MNNLRKSTIMLCMGVMVFSLLMIPFTPIASVDSQVSQALPDTQREFVEKWADRVENEMVGEKMDSMLVSVPLTPLALLRVQWTLLLLTDKKPQLRAKMT